MINWVKNNRFLIILSVLLVAGMFLVFIWGNSPAENITTSLQNFSANLASEIAGALISVWIIAGLINRHQQHSLRDVRHLLADTIRLSVYETINQAIGVIAKREYEIVNLSECSELLQNILECQTKEALTRLERLVEEPYPYYLPLDPTEYAKMKDIARVQQREWTDLQVRFSPYLSPSQVTTCAKIIDHLKDIYKRSGEVAIFQRLDDSEKNLLASQLSPQLVNEIKELTRECIELLDRTYEQ